MRPVRAVGLYLLFVFLGGALLAPWAYQFVQLLAHWVPALGSLAQKPFPRYVGRCLMVLAIIGLAPLLRAVELGSWRALGFGRRPDALSRLGAGFLWGLLSLALIVAIVLAAGARAPSPDLSPAAVLGQALKAALTAAVVSPLEELFFRGALFGALRKTFHWSMALVLSSFIYAVLHFLDRAPAPAVVNWTAGLSALGSMGAGLLDTNRLVPGVLNLTLAGMILGLAYQRSGSLHFSIGLHAGWIFWLKTYGSVTDDAVGSAVWFFGTGKLINGWLAFLVLAGVLAVLSRVLVAEDPHSGWKERRLFS